MRDERTGLEIDYSVNDTISEFGLATFKTTLSRVNETPVESHARASRAWCGGDMALAERLLDAASKKYFMWASPVIMNAPLPGEKIRGLPISCFLSAVTDSVAGLRDHLVEVVDLTTSGGGIGSHWGMIRSADDKSRGVIPHQRIADSMMGGFAQARGRRGSDCAWLPIWHPDAPEFINIRIPTQGDPARKCLGTGYHHGIIIPDSFMHQVEIDGPWDLIDPHTKKVVSTISARELWRSVLDARMRQGEPFIMYEDAVMKYFPKEQKALGLTSHGSNLCSEITLPTDEFRTAVCCLSSLNLENIKEWWDTSVVEDVLTMLDNVLTGFIESAGPNFKKAVYAAMRERAVGLGAMGFHSLLQSKSVPFESRKAQEINKLIFRKLRARADKHDLYLGSLRGEAPDMAGTGRRFSHKLAIAPNATSANALGTSPGIEPWAANIYTANTTAGAFTIRNPHLVKLLESRGMATPEIYESIAISRGSVQHLTGLSDHEKEVFKTARELDQRWIVQHAADRTPHICQAQSTNLFVYPDSNPDYVHAMHMKAWRDGCKTLYYLRSDKARTANVAGKVERAKLPSRDEPAKVTLTLNQMPVEEETSACVACEG